MNPVCTDCKYYLEAHSLQYCVLGHNPSTITECDSKEEGQTDYSTAIEECSQLDYLYPIGKGIEQAPTWLPKPVYYFSRCHKTYEDKTTRKVSIVFIVDKSNSICNTVRDKHLPTDHKFDYDSYYDKRIYTITWDEFIRESFFTSRKKRHRHTIN